MPLNEAERYFMAILVSSHEVGRGHIVENLNEIRQSSIVRYKLEEDCVNLRKSGLSYKEIAEELNSSGKVPAGKLVTKTSVASFLSALPEVEKELVKGDKKRLLAVVSTNLDIIHEINTLFLRTKTLMQDMEDRAKESGKHINPYQYKAVASEMREMLAQMTEIQKEINDYNNIRKFMEIVLQTLQDEVPEQIPRIVEKLRLAKGTQWFATIVGRKGGFDE